MLQYFNKTVIKEKGAVGLLFSGLLVSPRGLNRWLVLQAQHLHLFFYQGRWQWDVAIFHDHFLAYFSHDHLQEFTFQRSQILARLLVDVYIQSARQNAFSVL